MVAEDRGIYQRTQEEIIAADLDNLNHLDRAVGSEEAEHPGGREVFLADLAKASAPAAPPKRKRRATISQEEIDRAIGARPDGAAEQAEATSVSTEPDRVKASRRADNATVRRLVDTLIDHLPEGGWESAKARRYWMNAVRAMVDYCIQPPPEDVVWPENPAKREAELRADRDTYKGVLTDIIQAQDEVSLAISDGRDDDSMAAWDETFKALDVARSLLAEVER